MHKGSNDNHYMVLGERPSEFDNIQEQPEIRYDRTISEEDLKVKGVFENEKEILKFKPKQIFDEDVVKYDKFMIMHDKLIHERYDNTKII